MLPTTVGDAATDPSAYCVLVGTGAEPGGQGEAAESETLAEGRGPSSRIGRTIRYGPRGPRDLTWENGELSLKYLRSAGGFYHGV